MATTQIIIQGNYTELEVTQNIIDSICVSGSNDKQVEEAAKLITFPKQDAMFKEISEYNDYDNYKNDLKQIKEVYLWLMCWNEFDLQNESN
jgi:hypothetical protein